MAGCEIEILTSEYRKLDIPDGVVELDIGCGKGSFTTALAERYPDRHIFAADVMLGRLRKLAKRANRMGLENLQCLRVESGMLTNYMLPPGSIDRLHLLCPDPWPKKKHKGHRLVSSEWISRMAVVLKPGGIFHFSSDDVPYFDSVFSLMGRSGLFKEPDSTLIADIADIKTDFECLWESEGKVVRHAAWEVIK